MTMWLLLKVAVILINFAPTSKKPNNKSGLRAKVGGWSQKREKGKEGTVAPIRCSAWPLKSLIMHDE
jgi:hypothetical protein